ncbi:MAG: alkaline phosphatase family protein [Oscillibacter sp.]|nr:alkaline phosphatase family protein [Oscillibacter sp.]
MENKVLLILVDGMRPDAVPVCGEPDFEALFRKGVYSFHAKTTYPPVTLPCHMSLFHSVDAERHGISTNTFVPQNHPITGLVETLKAAGKTSAFFYTWSQLRDLCLPGKYLTFSWFMSQNSYEYQWLERRETAVAKEHIREFAPDFVFLYLGGTDEYGHDYGWMSPEYLGEVRHAAGCIFEIMDGLPEEYSVIITADHGGHGRSHGDDVPEDMTIPMAFLGKQFPAGTDIDGLNIRDIAPTIADILGVEPDHDWEGRSILHR